MTTETPVTAPPMFNPTRVLAPPAVDGAVLLPGHAGYDQARTIWNAIVDRRPRMIIRCASVRDVVTAVRTARELDLEIGVRCGGHSAVGHAVPDAGLMIDLTPMGGVRVDPRSRRAWVQGGAMLGALDRAAQRYGLATTAGNVSHTGVGGLTLGGGMGWLARQYGLACDNVVAFQVVTADGRVVRASATEHPDLFWGLRGGGGNFGVVTEFEFRLHQTGTQALTVEVDFHLSDGAEVLRGWRELNASAPRQATFTADVDPSRVTVGYVWVGNTTVGADLIPALRALGMSTGERVVETSYLSLQSRVDVVGGHAKRRYSKGHYFQEFTDVAIDALLAGIGQDRFTPAVDLQAYAGAISDVPDADAAFSHRHTMFELGASAGWTDAGEDEERIGAARSYAAALESFASGAYVNALNDEGSRGVRRAYSAEKLALLTAVKDAYDPDNTFHLNHNITHSARNGEGS